MAKGLLRGRARRRGRVRFEGKAKEGQVKSGRFWTFEFERLGVGDRRTLQLANHSTNLIGEHFEFVRRARPKSVSRVGNADPEGLDLAGDRAVPQIAKIADRSAVRESLVSEGVEGVTKVGTG
jgi:hypothetical protein